MSNVNVGALDRVVRIVVGLALIALTLTDRIGIWGWIGLVPLLTGIFSRCPAYSLLGVSSCKVR